MTDDPRPLVIECANCGSRRTYEDDEEYSSEDKCSRCNYEYATSGVNRYRIPLD